MIWNVDLVLCNLLSQFLKMLLKLYKRLQIFAEWEEKLSSKLVESSKTEQFPLLNSYSVDLKTSQLVIKLLLNLLMRIHKVLLNLNGLMLKQNKKLIIIPFSLLELTLKLLVKMQLVNNKEERKKLGLYGKRTKTGKKHQLQLTLKDI